ncbi:MAG: LOG family protein, partial [Rhodospirillaceae bacterium]
MTLAPSGTESAANSTPTGSLRALCVFCGASEGTNPAYMAAAERLGRQLGEQGITLVFGAGNVGIMGQVARATLGAGGSVIG